jgi:hypothetical protein
MKTTMALTIIALALTGCVATAPVTLAWRSNTHQQYATTEGRTDNKAGSDTVNAEKTIDAASAVNTSTGSATTNANKSNPEEAPKATSE